MGKYSKKQPRLLVVLLMLVSYHTQKKLLSQH